MSRRGYSDDLRARVIVAIEGGSSAREASRRFLVSGSSAARWAERRRRTGSFSAKADTGHSRSPLRAHREWLLAQIAHEPDLSLAVLRQRLVQQRALKVGLSSIWRFFARHGITFKKNTSCC